MSSNVYYLRNALYKPQMVADAFKQKVNVPYDVLVGTGISGVTGLMVLRSLLGANIAILRKEGERSHSPYRIENTDPYAGAPNRKWIFVDDLIDSGRTIRGVAEHFGRENCVGAFLYSYGTYGDESDIIFVPAWDLSF